MLSNLRVMSFNVRYGTADDGENSWSHRRAIVEQVIQDFGPDLLGTQEGVDFQVEQLREKLSDYTFVGARREDRPDNAEYVAIFFRTSRFTLLNAGHFWLSEDPHIVGSRGWDSYFPRMVTWCELLDANAAQQPIHFFNTHFDMHGKRARLESAILLRRHLDSLGTDRRIVVTGDFNGDEDEPPYQILISGAAGSSQVGNLIDSYRVAHPNRDSNELTRHDFRGLYRGSRIDWILHSGRYSTVAATIDRTKIEGRFPSDHYPVTAVLRLN